MVKAVLVAVVTVAVVAMVKTVVEVVFSNGV